MNIYEDRLAALQSQMRAAKLDALLVPQADEYQNESLPASAQRLGFLTGFTGSAGLAIILADKAAFFTDSRYTLQAQAQIPSNYEIFDTQQQRPSAWLKTQSDKIARLGYDPWLQSEGALRSWREALPKIEFLALAQNPIDAIWTDRPAPPQTKIIAHELIYAGRSSLEKREQLAAFLRAAGQSCVILSDPSVTAWLLNMRASDVPYTPLPLGFAIAYDDLRIDWFVQQERLDKTAVAALDDKIRILPTADFITSLTALGQTHSVIRFDPSQTASAIVEILRSAGAQLAEGPDPCALPRALKNNVEREGMRRAHKRDGAALVKFLSWLALQPIGTVTELQAEAKLQSFRAPKPHYRGCSFATIAGSGPHGAIVHYRATTETNRLLQEGELFLLDSGGQYDDGTTDVTRTIAIGTPTRAMQENYTRVVKGHIALAAAIFPVGTTGAELDALARQHLWTAGMDYGHGTGHGVGCFLGVHEGPQAISRRNTIPLAAGMVLSNEPGYYRAGEYGIRFENLMLVTEPTVPQGGDIPMLGFEILTLAPLDQRLLLPDMLSATEKNWINQYHARVAAAITPQLDPATVIWLKQATKPL
jgi:Xaa-Pro aminopeptidase